MALSMFEIGIIILLIAGISIMIVTFIFSRSFQKKLLSKIVVKGMNGLQGKTISLTCPPEMTISFDNQNTNLSRGTLVSLGDSTCDPFYQPGVGQKASFFNPATTVDVMDPTSSFQDVRKCEGKNSCSFVVPDSTDSDIPAGSCLKQARQIALIGTYDCISSKK